MFRKTLEGASVGSKDVSLDPGFSLLAFANFSTTVQHAENVKGRSDHHLGRGLSALFLFHDICGDPLLMRSYVELVKRFNADLSTDSLRWWQEILGKNFQALSKPEALDGVYHLAIRDLEQAADEGGQRIFQGSLDGYRHTMETLKTLMGYLQKRDLKEDYGQGKIRF